MSRSILVVAGEISGDLLAAGVVRAARDRGPAARWWGIGGDRMRGEGVELRHHVREMAVMGLSEVIARYGFFRRVFRDLLREVESSRPDLALLVDYPGFNLRLAAALHERGIRVVYYVCPQVWAWHRSRIPRMARILDHLMAIFPFEPAVFEGTGLRVDFVGHPLVDETRAALAEPPRPQPWHGAPRVALLPGSRRHEVSRILPVLWSAAAELERRRPGVSFIIAAPSPEIADLGRTVVSGLAPGPGQWEIVAGDTRQVVRQAHAAWVASGTATVEAMLLGCPMAVVYRTSPLTYFLGRYLVRVPHIGMVNLIAGREVCPEFIQGAARPEALATALEPLLDDTPRRRSMLEGLREASARLGAGGASEKAAELLLRDLDTAD